MDKNYKFDEADFKNVNTYAKDFAGIEYTPSLAQVIKSAFSDFRNLPNLGYPSKIEKGNLNQIPLKEYTKKLTKKYLKGYSTRPSLKVGQKSKTFSDPTMEILLSAKSKSLSNGDVTKVVEGHKILMTAENLLGDLLEEYLSLRLLKYGWHCCWGSSIDAVDFCNEDGRLLQIKNSDNSENSSSKRVRNGTTIIAWARRISTKENTFRWDYLIEETGADNISEDDFRVFVSNTVKNNPKSLFTPNNSRFN